MRKYFFSILLICPFLALYAQEQQEIKLSPKLNQVTVYLSGAELYYAEKVSLPKGRTEIRVQGLPYGIDPNTIQVGAGDKVMILSVTAQYNSFLDPVSKAKAKAVQDSIRLHTTKWHALANERKVLESEKSLYVQNMARVGAQGGVTTAQLLEAGNFYRSKLAELEGKLTENEIRKAALDSVLQGQQNRLNEWLGKTRDAHDALIAVKTEAPVETELFLSLLASNAGWEPKYEVRAKGVEDKIRFTYRGSVVNGTGVDWKQIRIRLSSGNPTQSLQAPVLSTNRLKFAEDFIQQQVYNMPKALPAPRAAMEADEFGGGDIAGLVEDRASIVPVGIEVSEVSVDFDIKEPYTIPANNQEYTVDVAEYELPASYHYLAIPKIDKDAFLIANLTDWTKLNLMEGQVNIFYKNNFVGSSYINPTTAGDTLAISLGRDKKVIIRRTKLQDFAQTRFMGGTKRETTAFEIEVRNTNTVPVKFELQDQVPVSGHSEIEVEVEEISGARRNEETGQLTWKMDLQPGEVRKVKLIFTVRYPKNKRIGGGGAVQYQLRESYNRSLKR